MKVTALRMQHPLRRMQALVGRRSKTELTAIGGCWEPVDGGHPRSSPEALIATAVRTFREATGLDLSACSQW